MKGKRWRSLRSSLSLLFGRRGTSSAGETGRDNRVGSSSVAIASFDRAAVDPLGEALAALDDRDYATAQRLFAALGRKDAAEAIKDALAALDRRDYAMAQGLFEALNQKGTAAARVKGAAPAAPAKAAASAGGPMASDSRNKARQNPVTSPGRSCSIWGSNVSPVSASGGKGKIASPKTAFTRNRLGVICDLRCICTLWFAAKLDVPHHEKPSDRRSYLSC